MTRFTCLLICFVAANPIFVSALSSDQQKALDSGVYYFNTEDPTEPCAVGGSTTLVGSDNAEKIYNFFVSRGLQPFQAAGIMGNMMAESGLNPRALQPGGEGDQPINGRGFGLVQWTFTVRQKPLVERAQAANVLPSDLGVQLEYVLYELDEVYPAVGDDFRATTNVRDATLVIEDRYEIHAGPRQPRRIQWAEGFLAQFGGNASGGSGSSSGGTACATDGSGQVVGNFSLPVDRRWYDEHQVWFTKPHHDYPAADIPVPVGTPVYSMTAGTVTNAPNGGACGTGVSIDAGSGVTFTYCHGSDGGSITGAREGDTVSAGQLIMHSANTGRSTGPHLHLGIKVNGENRCPQELFVGIANGTPPAITSLPSSGCTN
ncbi:M23 family metallopeptidase [Candidatus Saccharibacteria bacterium]|nr:M23 family metallopeptidase [Candidatus Saccharibacteria bacterium]